MKKIAIIGTLSLFISGVMFLGFFYGQNIPFSEQWQLYETLRTTASIIFAVVGAWIAIIYPERLKFTFKPIEEVKNNNNNSNMGKLLHPAINSTGILCIILIIGVSAPIIKQLPFIQNYRIIARGISYSILVVLTIWQLWTIILTLIPADMIKRKSDLENAKQQQMDNFFSRSHHHDKK